MSRCPSNRSVRMASASSSNGTGLDSTQLRSRQEGLIEDADGGWLAMQLGWNGGRHPGKDRWELGAGSPGASGHLGIWMSLPSLPSSFSFVSTQLPAPTPAILTHTTMPSTLTFDLTDGIARITVNRPDKLNALNAIVIGELGDAVTRIETDAPYAVSSSPVRGQRRSWPVQTSLSCRASRGGWRKSPGAGGPAGVPSAGALGKTCDRGHQRLCPGRRL